MARVLEWKRRAAAVQDEVDYFWAGARPVPGEWQRRIHEQDAAIGAGGVLRESVAAHFGERYAGDAFEEWLRDLFDAPISRLRDCTVVCRAKMETAAARYSA